MSSIKTNQLAHTANGAATYTLPQTDGSAGQVLTTNGSGVLSWATPSSMTLLATMSLSGMNANTVSQSLNLTGYKDLKGYITGLNLNDGTLNDTWFTFNGNNSSGDYSWVRHYLDNSGDTSTNRAGSNTGYAYGSVGPGFFYNGAGFAGVNADDNEGVFHLYNVNGGTKKTFSMLHTNFLTRNMVFNTIIPRNVSLGEAPSHGESIIVYNATSKGSKSYIKFAQEIINLN